LNESLLLALIAAASYLAGRVAFDWIGRKFFVVSGAEYLLLGILLGPYGARLLTESSIESFSPILTLGLGWVGARFGAQIVLPALVRIPAVFYRTALVESMLTLIGIGGSMTLLLMWVADLALSQALIPGLALGAIATASAQAGVALLANRAQRRSFIVRQLEVSAGMNSMIAIVAMGLLLAAVHPKPIGLERALTPTEWAVITVMIGLVGGSLFHLFLGEERKVDRMFIALGGAIFVVSGAATYMRLSPILSGMCFGIVLVNSTRARAEITAALDRVERPLYFAMLIFGGAAWQPTREWILPAVLFLVLRTMWKIGGARLASRWNGTLVDLGPNWGRAIVGQGGLAVALGLSYAYQEVLEQQNLVFSAAVLSVLLTDLLSARFARGLLPIDDLLPGPRVSGVGIVKREVAP
jgi:hypothetical protein